jgi:type 1 glutamine amidotransferase
MKRLCFILICAMVIASPIQAQQQPGTSKIQTLIITGQNGHDWKGTTPLLRKMLEDCGRFTVRVTEEFRGAGPETLAPYDLVVLNYYELRKPELRWGDKTDNAFLDFVRSGKGVVVYHFSVAAFDGWTEYEKICAGNWRPNNGHHSAAHDFTVDIKDPEHPITRGLKASFPQPKDELYANLRWQPADSFHILATAWDDHSLYNKEKARQPIPGAGIHQPMLWTVSYGSGKVFVTVLGHDIPAVQTPAFITTFLRGAEWAATGSVTLPIPPEMAK